MKATQPPIIAAAKILLVLFLFFATAAPAVAASITVADAFAPEQGATDLIVKTIGEAKTSIRVSAELLPYIFDLFVQEERSLDRKQGGLGLGLTLVRRLVELQDGTVEAKSRGLKQGSEFIVRLPAIAAVEIPLAAIAPAALPKMPVAGRRILVVDDNADAAKTTQILLELRGHEVQVVLDGLSGLQAAPVFKPQVILLDIGLPGMDGYEVARRLRAAPETKDILLIALSGYGQMDDLRKAKEAGFDHHLLKPADTNQLQDLIMAAA